MKRPNPRIRVIDASGPAADRLFRRRSLEAVEVRETLAVEVSAHVYEELAIRKTVTIRERPVATVLRREAAEITATGAVRVAEKPIEG